MDSEDRCQVSYGVVGALTAAFLCMPVSGARGREQDAELEKFQGRWEVSDLAEDGRAVSKQQIREMLPSGGRAEIVDNAILFRSPKDNRRGAKTFAVDPTTYPKQINVSDAQGGASRGIYQFDQGRLIICMSDPDAEERPSEFSAARGSKQMLMVLRRPSASGATPPPKPSAAGRSKPPAEKLKPVPEPQEPVRLQGLTDSELTKQLAGAWVLRDSAGALYITLSPDGTCRTVREYLQVRVFHRTFVQTPISSGTWKVENGRLATHVTSSVHWERVNRIFSFVVRSVSADDAILLDELGRIVRVTRVRSP